MTSYAFQQQQHPQEEQPPQQPQRNLRVGTLNVQTPDVAPYAPRIKALAAVVNAMDADVLCIQEATPAMATALFAATTTHYVSSVEGGYLSPIVPDPKSYLFEAGKCYGPDGKKVASPCANVPPVPEGQNVNIFFKDDKNVQLVGMVRKAYSKNTGCPGYECNRFYTAAAVSVAGKLVMVYTSHSAQSKDKNKTPGTDIGWGHEANDAQQRELYADVAANASGSASRPFYRTGADSECQLSVAGLPFVIAGDLNEKDHSYWRNLPGVKVDVHCLPSSGCTAAKQVDYIISSADGIKFLHGDFVPTHNATDHSAGLVADYAV